MGAQRPIAPSGRGVELRTPPSIYFIGVEKESQSTVDIYPLYLMFILAFN